MSTDHVKDPKPIRLVFELARADHPRLYDELIQFHKGTKRVNRLRVLAYDGLLAQSGVFAEMGRGSPHLPSASSAQEGNGDITNDLFAPAIDA
ncbi:MAG: hypothetical protein AW10_00403 [Candidatus Accumulibacter appositus]|jgi:hypothetical protein|uniref:Uncharacterized protein n=1 Tax=Candidatus Accumulibacter appositus TaxID=1454003 RepID=A0A011Q079_9PROT|nr:hypothetical protein [Accumulibacter sp.]EXI82617.1 MAG: hypothetical protein AW10_00403 [Candidatus Accumulibacter appositus]HRF05337.1 hypothetical protein [Accumulibacter sp.]HRF13169.1 hypothetical protein [Candidatus Accumulibacter phosphatis]